MSTLPKRRRCVGCSHFQRDLRLNRGTCGLEGEDVLADHCCEHFDPIVPSLYEATDHDQPEPATGTL